MNLPVIGKLWLPFRKISVFDEMTRVDIAFDAMIFNKPHTIFDPLAEFMFGAGGDSDDDTFQRKIANRLLHSF
jgi:hypothetical protein